MTSQLKTGVRRVARPAELRALANPLRQELVDLIESLGGEAEVARLAELLGRPADGLYYHLELLVKAGLLQPSEGAGGGRRYRILAARGQVLLLDYRGGTAHRRAVGRVLRSALQQAERDVQSALARPGVVDEGPQRELWAGRCKGWVDAEGLLRVNQLLGEIQQIVRDGSAQLRANGEARLLSFSFALAPVAAAPKRRAARAKPKP